MITATGEHWSEEVTRFDEDRVQKLYYLQLAYIIQTRELAMRRCGEWLAENWNKVEWSQTQ